ncbi:MAG: transketolase [Candidatus Kerfeldbacteria bacterium CG15_BIG_FIL_POST_REV_8_21_14_020_45_12]|uniref:Transketolase n=1 Tax=Candidatus Kerfeldbacteria bacterium CG15_BIG_FIL_POST_REV_8_21_14_020_45_12 TaxID=2014247 RepID=A0A2M7H462_9BACT|nr:MAG: transketolase [Candidatus Kerfeldbacteria bacterium CG15_BIG_FIL_POST_REV_8_21_14_020_45_12]PJA93668.1 MAG: transketolase [Candidatus Kerfeldbacteria bacterium CG_4_9_14_3_um_filter_45_8]
MTPIQDHKALALKANQIRKDILISLNKAGSGHSGGPLGMADIFTCLYFNALKHDPAKPNWEDRDRILLSNGHICPVLYASMAHAGYFPVEELTTLRQLGSRLQGHPHRTALPGLETTSGPLGSGLSQGAGMALAAKMDGVNHHIVVCGSDGEQQEGNVWEAVLLAAKYKLDNLIYIIDRNFIQIDGNTEDIMPLEPIKDKYEAFNWHVIEIDGHNYSQIIDAVTEAKNYKRKPILINAITVPGKGVSYMEDDYTWHGKPPSDEELATALEELEAVRTQIEEGTYEY